MITQDKQESIIKEEPNHLQLKESFFPKSSSSKELQKPTSPNLSPQKKEKNKLKPKQGRWQINEEVIYIKYLQENQMLFESEYSRRSQKVFDQLAKIFRNSRTAEQCRSHHQKMQKKVGSTSITAIIEYIKRKNERKEKMHIREKLKQEGKMRTRQENVEYFQHPKKKYEIKVERKKICLMTIKLAPNYSFICW